MSQGGERLLAGAVFGAFLFATVWAYGTIWTALAGGVLGFLAGSMGMEALQAED